MPRSLLPLWALRRSQWRRRVLATSSPGRRPRYPALGPWPWSTEAPQVVRGAAKQLPTSCARPSSTSGSNTSDRRNEPSWLQPHLSARRCTPSQAGPPPWLGRTSWGAARARTPPRCFILRGGPTFGAAAGPNEPGVGGGGVRDEETGVARRGGGEEKAGRAIDSLSLPPTRRTPPPSCRPTPPGGGGGKAPCPASAPACGGRTPSACPGSPGLASRA